MKRIAWMALAWIAIAAGGAAAEDGNGAVQTSAVEVLERAICRACEIRGSTHGEEDVAASRHYEGKDYYFCAEACAAAFDGFPDAYAVHPVPRPAPSVILTTTDGDETTVGEPDGGMTLLDFWATWCAPCVKAMPELAKLQRTYQDRGLNVVGVSIDDDPKKLTKFLKKNPSAYSIAHDSGELPAWQAYAVAAIPAMYLIDGDGRIVGEWRGAVDIDDVTQSIEDLLAATEKEQD